MEQQINKDAKKEFNERLDRLSDQELPSLTSGNKAFIVLYEKLMEIERKVNELKHKELVG